MNNTLNLLNGMAMYSKVLDKDIHLDGDVEPFNEAMCQGDALAEIFSHEFIADRAVWLGITSDEYELVVTDHLKKFFSMDYEHINLYFDADMFCQINLLTVLGYLDYNEYQGSVSLHIVDYDYRVLGTTTIKLTGFYRLYKHIIVDRQYPDGRIPETLYDGIINYIMYKNGSSPLHDHIINNPTLDQETLLSDLMQEYSEYGLGDIQLLALIDEIRTNSSTSI